VSFAEAQAIIDDDVDAILDVLGERIAELDGASILVTGSAGMLGGYFADVAAALRAGSEIRAGAVHLATRHPPEPYGRLGHLLSRGDIEFVVTDGRSRDGWPKKVDVIIHAASAASPRQYLADPVGTLTANSVYLANLLELARDSSVRAFLFVSSSEIYGSPPDTAIPTPETYIGGVDPLAPRSCYVEGKRFGEALCVAHHREYGTPISIIRPFHVHGPGLRLDDGRIVAELVRAALRGEPFQLDSDGLATRCYGYIADAIVGAFMALLYGNGEAFNIGVDEPETSIRDLAGVVAAIAGTPPPIPSPRPLPEHLLGAPARSRPDLTKARRILGFNPRTPLRAGLERTLSWHQAVGSVPV
jgi:UDP-glucuronate decarboxylase